MLSEKILSSLGTKRHSSGMFTTSHFTDLYGNNHEIWVRVHNEDQTKDFLCTFCAEVETAKENVPGFSEMYNNIKSEIDPIAIAAYLFSTSVVRNLDMRAISVSRDFYYWLKRKTR